MGPKASYKVSLSIPAGHGPFRSFWTGCLALTHTLARRSTEEEEEEEEEEVVVVVVVVETCPGRRRKRGRKASCSRKKAQGLNG